MSSDKTKSYARFPTFSAVIDVLASGLGIARNKDDALSSLASFAGRIEVYSGSGPGLGLGLGDGRPGLGDRILDALAGQDTQLRAVIQARLLDFESALSFVLAAPVLTMASEDEGFAAFLDVWAAPWIAQMLVEGREHPLSVLDASRALLEEHAAVLAQAQPGDEPRFLATAKRTIRQAIPEGARASEFLTIIGRLDQKSQRKLESIEKDLSHLVDEMRGSISPPQDLEVVVAQVRRVYVAAMVISRLCAMAAGVVDEATLIKSIVGRLHSGLDARQLTYEPYQEGRIRLVWSRLNAISAYPPAVHFLFTLGTEWNKERFDKALGAARSADPDGMFSPFIDYMEGRWHLGHGHMEVADACFSRVVAASQERQLGSIASDAAGVLIGMRLAQPESAKHEALNKLMRVRIDFMKQRLEMHTTSSPTPFSSWSDRPEASFYDGHLMRSVGCFNGLPRAPGASGYCNPLQRFDEAIPALVEWANKKGAKLNQTERKRPAIAGTSIRPYQFLRNNFFYVCELFGGACPPLPGLDSYAKLPDDDQLRVLRFVDPDQFLADLTTHGMAGWRHPDD
jgi:hypothetical protein